MQFAFARSSCPGVRVERLDVAVDECGLVAAEHSLEDQQVTNEVRPDQRLASLFGVQLDHTCEYLELVGRLVLVVALDEVPQTRSRFDREWWMPELWDVLVGAAGGEQV